jgi:glycosyltransferase involved in cell wall biosynthesis
MMSKKLFLVVNVDWALFSHRLPVVLAALQQGYEVTIVTKNTGRKGEIESLGLKFIDLPMSRSSLNPLEGLRTFLFLWFLYWIQKPDIIHHVGLKTILYGTLASKFACAKGVINAVNGLGILFSPDNTSVVSKIIIPVFRFSHRRRHLAVIFQNDDDKALFLNKNIIKKDQVFKIKGSGVNLNIFSYIPEKQAELKIRILFIARMIKEKGVLELIEAARILEANYKDRVTFLLCGGLDDNPHAISKEFMEKHCDGEYIQWLGHRSNVKELLEQSHIFVFPSYYREGIPKSLIEACAVGRPIITSDSPGCRECVINNYNGYLVPVKDTDLLAQKMETLINDKEKRVRMGLNSRKLAEKEFSVENVIEKHLEIYSTLI